MTPRQRLAALCALALALLACGCDSSSPHVGPPRRFVLADTLTLTLPVEAAWVRAVESDRLLLEHDGLVLRVQQIDGESRSAESVAGALVTRYALGEQTGMLTHSGCRFASVEGAQCLTGTFERGGIPWSRRGAVLEGHGNLVWIDVAGPSDRADDVQAWTESLASRATLASSRVASANLGG